MARAKLKKNVAVSFLQNLTGHNKNFIGKNFEEDSNGGYWFDAGLMKYHFWPLEGRIYCQFFIGGTCTNHGYFNLESFEYDYLKSDESRQKEIENIVHEILSDK